ncbi:MAG TPA: hypothetical protein VHF47_01250 [Acidimicrobiales bacterium]|nr:hypothetical protein [Acidimicrobiales bacterium]
MLLAAGLAVGLVVRLHLAVTDDSVHWPDQVHKTIEAGHRVAFGYGWQPWEYVHGAVSWTVGGLLGAVLWMLAAVGLDDPHRYVVAVRALVAVASLSASWAVYRAVRDWDGGELAACVAGALSALAAPAVYFAHRPLSETLSLAPITFGMWLTLRPRGRWHAVGAALLAFAVLLRLQNALFCAVALAALALARDWRRLRVVGAVLAAGALVYGVVDWATWGVPFHSAWEYVNWNVMKDVAGAFGESPFHYYLRFLFLSIGPVSLLLVVLAAAAGRRAPALVAAPLVFLLAHSVEGHKEARFVLAVVPLLCIAVGIGLDEVGRRVRRQFVVPVLGAVVLAPVAFQAVTIERLTMRDVGQDHLFAAGASAFAQSGEVNRLLFAAHRRPDLCGIRLATLEAPWSGGYSHLHRDVPFYDKHDPVSGRYNYEIAVRDPTDTRFVAADGGYGLRRLGARCEPDPAFSTRFADPATR